MTRDSPPIGHPHPSPLFPSPSFLRPIHPSLGSTSSAGFHQPPQSTHRRPTAPITSTRGLAPILDHSEDWLDQNAVDSRRSQTPNLFNPGLLQYWNNHHAASSEEPEEVVEGSQNTGMSPQAHNATHHERRARSGYVDLTEELATSSPMRNPPHLSATHKRRLSLSGTDDDSNSDPDTKRSKPFANDFVDDAFDLTEEPISAEEALRQSQHQDAIQSQRQGDDSGPPVRIGRKTCIICMEAYTNATVTTCGHLFCHECLIQALMAGEKNTDRGIGNCPVCRKALPRKSKNHHNIIPISFMKRGTYRGKRPHGQD